MKLLAIFATGITLISSISAAPASLPSDLQVRGKECPSVKDIEDWIKADRQQVGARTVFYTKPAETREAQIYAGTIGAEFWGSVFDDKKQLYTWFEECGVGDEQNKLFPRMSEALD